MLRIPAVLLLCVTSLAHAEVIEFEIPGLAGSSADSVIIDSLVYNGPDAIVNAISFRVTGVVDDLGEMCCGGPEYCTGQTSPWIMTWWSRMGKSGDNEYGDWVASVTEYLSQVAPFDQIGPAESQNGFPTLSDGDVINVRLYFGAAGWPDGYECELYRSPSGTLYTVTIMMNLTATLPAQSVTWGRVKTLFN